ncbi:uncharacterized, partial [Tachysurus ichikawai]
MDVCIAPSMVPLSGFEPFSPQTSGSRENAHIKVRIGGLELYKEEHVEQRQAEHELKVEREIRLRELDMRAKEFTLQSTTQACQLPLPVPKPESPAPTPIIHSPGDE